MYVNGKIWNGFAWGNQTTDKEINYEGREKE
jgi:hypothetical protein